MLEEKVKKQNREASLRYYYKNKDRIREQKNLRRKELRKENIEKVRASDREYYAKNKERLKKIRDTKRKELNAKRRKYYEDNKEFFKEYRKKRKVKHLLWVKKNKETLKEKKKLYYQNNKEKIYAYIDKRKKNDYKFKIGCLIRAHFKQAFNLYSKAGKTKALKQYGIDIKVIAEHLGSPPQNEKQYHIDHIFPVCAFDLNNPDHIRLCWHPDNLRWLEASENMSKGDKYNEKEFENYIKNHL